MEIIRFMQLSPDVKLPYRAHDTDAGWDIEFNDPNIYETYIDPGDIETLRTSLISIIPEGYEMQIRPRSGLAMRCGITILNSPGTVDAGYRGEIRIVLINHGRNRFAVRRGDRIAQLVPRALTSARFEWADTIDGPTERNSGGFGSTGR